MNSFIVYKHTFPNQKVYIGITCCEPRLRWRNGLGYNNQPIMRNAIKKYGWENIKHEIVAENLTKEEACNEEVRLIALYDSTNTMHGYNVTTGGEHYEMTESHKLKISRANKGKPSHLKGKKMSESRKRKIGLSNKGKKRTEEQRRKQSEYMKSIDLNGGKNPRARKVRCIENGIIFDCVTDASVWAGVSRGSVTDALNGRSHTSANYHWEYVS